MIIDATYEQALAVARAMHDVASARETEPLSLADHLGIESAFRTVFGRAEHLDVDALAPIAPADLATALGEQNGLRLDAVRVLAVMALVDGVVDQAKLQLVVEDATALGVQADFVRAIHELCVDHIRWVALDQIRENVATIPGLPWIPDDPYKPFLPYGGDGEDPELTARYRSLGELPDGTFGRAFFEHYTRNGFQFPGEQYAMNEVWATPHDSLHVLSGYSTSAQGELLVATFTGAQFRPPRNVDMMESHVLPTILIYHMGIVINKGLNGGDRERFAADPSWRDNFSGNVHLGLDPAKLWKAWERGQVMSVDAYDPAWDFWSLTDDTVDGLRDRYGIPPLDPADAALADDAIRRHDFDRPGQSPLPAKSGEGISDHPGAPG